MKNPEELREQRRYERFSPKEWVSAFCQTSIVGIGKLVDISKGGAAFQYVQRSTTNLALYRKSLVLDVFETVTYHGVKGMECKVVYDTEMPMQGSLSGGYRIRRCGVEFTEHNWYQSFQLDMFIKDFTVSED